MENRHRQEFNWDYFNRVPIVGIVRGLTLEQIKMILPIYISAGLTTIEITMNTPGAAATISYLAEHYDGQLNIGAGTVCDRANLRAALDAGASFIVTPVLVEEVISDCVTEQIPIFPGAYTPTEIFRAWQAGASMVKVYPATALGAGYIRDVKAPLNHIKLLPTGGIDKTNILEFMKAGADGLGVGSQLFDKKLIAEMDLAKLEGHFKEYASYFLSSESEK